MLQHDSRSYAVAGGAKMVLYSFDQDLEEIGVRIYSSTGILKTRIEREQVAQR
jgi:hypothetical protein